MSAIRKVVHWLPANGFPIGVYAPIFKQMESCLNQTDRSVRESPYVVTGSDVYPFLGSRSVTWEEIAYKTLPSIEKSAANGPIVGVGHSFGGALMASVAALRPELFSSIIVMDSPMIFSGLKRWAFGFVPQAVMDRKNPLVASALRRMSAWESKEAVLKYMDSKKLYNGMRKDVFNSFLQNGFKENESGGYELVWGTTEEVNAYYMVVYQDSCKSTGSRNGFGPYNFSGEASRRVPSTFLYSNQFPFLTKGDIRWGDKFYPDMKFVAYDDGHFWPFTKPDACIEELSRIILATEEPTPGRKK